MFKTAIDTLKLAAPIILSQLSYMALSVTDNIMVGHLGKVPLAASALAGSVFVLPLVFGIGLTYAISALGAQAMGKSDAEESEAILKNGFFIGIITGLLGAIIIFGLAELLPYLNKNKEVTQLARPFLQILGLSFIPLMLYMPLKQFSEGEEKMKIPLVIALSSVPLNVLLNYSLINGKLGMPQLGFLGAAWATMFSRLFMFIAGYCYIIMSPHFKRYNPSNMLKFKLSSTIIRKINAVGIPGGIQYVFETAAFSVAAIMIGWVGTSALAAHQIAINMASVTFMIAMGISSAGSIKVGNALGQNNPTYAKEVGKVAIAMAMFFMGLCGILFVTFGKQIAELYIEDQQVITITQQLLLIAAIFQMSDGAQAVGVGLLRGLEDSKVPTVLVGIAYWVIAIPLGWFFSTYMSLGVVGIWYGLLIGLTASALFLCFRFFKNPFIQSK